MSNTRTINIFYLIIALGAITALCIYLPAFREVLDFLLSFVWSVFKTFYLLDTIKQVVLHIILLTVIVVLGFTITKKTRRKVWSIAGCIIDIAGVIALIMVNK